MLLLFSILFIFFSFIFSIFLIFYWVSFCFYKTYNTTFEDGKQIAKKEFKEIFAIIGEIFK